MRFVIYQDNGGLFHWRLIGSEGVGVAVSATAFESRQGAFRAAADVPVGAPAATGFEADRVSNRG